MGGREEDSLVGADLAGADEVGELREALGAQMIEPGGLDSGDGAVGLRERDAPFPEVVKRREEDRGALMGDLDAAKAGTMFTAGLAALDDPAALLREIDAIAARARN